MPRSSHTVVRENRSSSRRSWLISTMPARIPANSRSSHSMPGRSRWLVGSSSSRMSGKRRQRAGQRGAARLAAGQRGGIFFAGKAEFLEQIQRAVAVRRAAASNPAST